MRFHQIISRLPDTADDEFDVLFDFDDLFRLQQGTTIGPPEMRYAKTWTHMVDGERISASSFGNRELKIEVSAYRGHAELQAEKIQLLARLLAEPRGQWFLWQDEGTVEPRYFRTMRASIEIEDLLLLEYPKRGITMTIPAEPFAQGDLVEETYTVTNDPTTGTNPMVIEIDDIKGDVPTPVWMSIDYADTALTSRNVLVASSATRPDIDGGLVIFEPGGFVGDHTGFERVTVTDSTAIGGTCIRYQHLFHPIGDVNTVTTKVSVPGVERGDYRILVRVRAVYSTPGSVTFRVFPGIGDSVDVPITAESVTADDDWQWVDGGIARFPGGAPIAPDRHETDLNYSMLSTIGMRIDVPSGAGTSLDVDTIMLVPAGLDRAALATMLRAQQIPTIDDSQVWIDGINDQTNLVADDTVTSTTRLAPIAADGDTPYLVPGALNRIFVVGHTFSTVQTPEADDKTDTFDVTVRHRAQYLYIRSATG